MRRFLPAPRGPKGDRPIRARQARASRSGASAGTPEGHLAVRAGDLSKGGILLAVRDRLSRMPRVRPSARVRCRVRRVVPVGLMTLAILAYREAGGFYVAGCPSAIVTLKA